MSSTDPYQGLREQLAQLEWPRIYPFKFIVPIEQADAVYTLFRKQDTTTKVSKKGNYISVTAKPYMYSSDKVIEVYEKAAKIEGLMAL